MILPYKIAEPRHTTAGLEIGMDEYVHMLLTTMTWTVSASLTFDLGGGSTSTYELSGTLDRQFFTGPFPPSLDGSFESNWASKAMTTATRRVVYDSSEPSTGSMRPLKPYDLSTDYPETTQRFVGAWMTWVGTLDRSISGGGDSYADTIKDALCLPLMGAPTDWWISDTEFVLADRFKFNSFDANRLYLPAPYDSLGGVHSLNGMLGNTAYAGFGAPETTGVPATIKGNTVHGAASGFVHPPVPGAGWSYSSGSIALTVASTW